MSNLATPTTPNPATPTISTPDHAYRAAVLASVNVLFAVLSIRFVLLLAVMGAIYLAALTVLAPDPWRLGALAIYAILVVAPTVWLAARQAR